MNHVFVSFVRIVFLTVVLHWALFGVALVYRGSLKGTFHDYYESTLYQIISLLDLPAGLFAEQIGFPLEMAIFESSGLNLFVNFMLITLQWTVIGAVIAMLFSLAKKNESPNT